MRVRRDRWGVPHIIAASAADLWFAEGFCHGQDRLWQMDFYRRALSGRVSEFAGEEGLPVDRLMRTLGMRRTAEREAAAIDPDLRALLERFCEGVNAAAASARALPFEMQLLRLDFEPWRPADILGLGKLLAFGLSTNWEKELLRADMTRELGPELAARLDPGYPADNPVVTQEPWSGDGLGLAEQIDAVRRSIGMAAEASGSNNWAVSGALSATGSPLMAGDPHLPQSMPGIWYQVSLTLGDRFVRGASLPGMPGVYMGQNNDVCWSFTNVMADVQDLFVERVDGDRYLFEGEWQPLEIVREEIAVKGRDAPEVLDVRLTHHGPLVNEALGADDAEPLALRWTALDRPTAFAGDVRPARDPRRPGARGRARGPHGACLQPDLGRPPRLDRLQADRSPAAAQRRLPRPAQAWLGGRVRVGGDRSLRRAARGHRPRERLPDHRQQPHRRRRVPAPHHQRLARRLPGAADRGAAARLRGTRRRGLRGDAVRQPLDPRSGGGAAAGPADAEGTARAERGRAAAQLGRAARPRLDRRHDLPGLPAAAGARGRPCGDRRP